MDIETKSDFDYVDFSVADSSMTETSVPREIDPNSSRTFCEHPYLSELQIKRVFGYPAEREIYENVANGNDLNKFAEVADLCQIFRIRQRNSYSRLLITRKQFEKLLQAYSVFYNIWDFMVPFGFKTRESDIGSAPCKFHQVESLELPNRNLGSFECAYGFRYVVQNHRTEAMKDNLDYDPWSVRQSVVYQQYSSTKTKITFILVAPSTAATENLENEIRRCGKTQKRLNPFDLHRIIISTLQENWRLYIRSLEHLLKYQSERFTLAKIRSEAEGLSPIVDFSSFVDRQRLKIIEDKILDLMIIFESLYSTLSKLKDQCHKHCIPGVCVDCTCPSIIDELEDQMCETQLNLKKADVLYKRVQGIAQLLSDLLNYENAQIGHLNGTSLNGLAKETKEENNKMRVLSERSTKDAAAVKILTVITLFYLPMTVVASIFSSQLIHVNDSGQVSVVSGSWWFVVVAAPLTIVTFLAWRYWLAYSIKKDERNQISGIDHEKHTILNGWLDSTGIRWCGKRVAQYIFSIRHRRGDNLGNTSHGA